MRKLFFITFIFMGFNSYTQKTYSLLFNAHSYLKNLDNSTTLTANNLKKLDGFIVALLVKDIENKKPKYRIEMVSNSLLYNYNIVEDFNPTTKIKDIFLALNFTMASVSYTFNKYNFSLNFGLGINMLSNRRYYNANNKELPKNLNPQNNVVFGKHFTLNNIAEIENSFNITDNIQLNLAVRYTGGLVKKFTNTKSFTFTTVPGNNISVLAGVAIKLFGAKNYSNYN